MSTLVSCSLLTLNAGNIININTSGIRGLRCVTLTNLMTLTLLTGVAMLCRPKILNTVLLAGVSHHQLSLAFKSCRLSWDTGRRSRLSADIGREI